MLRNRTALASVLFIIFSWLAAGCASGGEEVTTTVETTAEMEAPVAVITARDAVIDFVREGAIIGVPPEGVHWRTEAGGERTPADFGVYRFSAEETLITVSYSQPGEAETLYNVSLTNDAVGFCWHAVVNARGSIVKTGDAALIEPGAGNPAAIYCEEAGNSYEIRTLEDGTLCGACVFPDGSACKGWDFFYGDCQPGDNPPE